MKFRVNSDKIDSRLEKIQDRSIYLSANHYIVDLVVKEDAQYFLQLSNLLTFDMGDIRNKVELNLPNIEGQEVDLGDELNYVIGFENTGNDDATNLTIRDILPTNIACYPNKLVG